MRPDLTPPPFEELLRFAASKYGPSPKAVAPSALVLAAARAAHRRLWAPGDSGGGAIECLELLAASSGDAARPSELVTVRGFRVRLHYRDGADGEPSSICVLVQSPQEWVAAVQGQIAYLWNGAERFELGEFDADGKAIGTLPAGIEISLADFTAGRVKLEAPDLQAGR